MTRQDPRSHPPVIASLTSANAEFNRWLKENGSSRLEDALGLIWEFRFEQSLRPDPVNLHARILSLHFVMETRIDRQKLLDLGLLDASKDQRLLGLMGASSFHLQSRRLACEAPTLELLRTQAHEEFRKFRGQMKAWNSAQLIIGRVHALIDRQFDMSGLWGSPVNGKNSLET